MTIYVQIKENPRGAVKGKLGGSVPLVIIKRDFGGLSPPPLSIQ